MPEPRPLSPDHSTVSVNIENLTQSKHILATYRIQVAEEVPKCPKVSEDFVEKDFHKYGPKALEYRPDCTVPTFSKSRFLQISYCVCFPFIYLSELLVLLSEKGVDVCLRRCKKMEERHTFSCCLNDCCVLKL